jgi:3-hydroxyacyl-[acyl-carrier-protein] dehydratase
MNKEELKAFLPHRDPMLLVDEMELDAEGVCHAKYLVKENEYFCSGHFPGNPIVPGVIQCEIMAQSCALLVKEDLLGKTTLYTGIDKVRFKSIVKPGDLCEITARLLSRKGPMVFCQAELRVKGNLCCKGELSFALV